MTSFRFVGEGSGKLPQEEGESPWTSLSYEGHVVKPDKSRMALSLFKDDGELRFELGWVIIGDEVYGRNPITGEWESGQEYGFGGEWFMVIWPQMFMVVPDELGENELGEMSEELVQLADENIDGVACYHFQAQVPLPPGSTAKNDWWIGKADLLAYQVQLEVQLEAEATILDTRGQNIVGPASWRTVLKLSSFDEPVTIEAP